MEPRVYILSLKYEIEPALFSSLLSVVRKEKAERILAQKKKQQADAMLAGELLAMYAVREVFGIPMSEQKIGCDKCGKPYLLEHGNVFFNISHSRNYIAVAVCDCPVGIDVEHLVPWRDSLARRISTPKEWEQLRCSADRDTALTELWTRKEAAAKMDGSGLAGIKSGTLKNARFFTSCLGDAYVSCAVERLQGT